MANREFGAKHRLLIYRFIAARFRPMGIALFVMGLVALLPVVVAELRPQGMALTYEHIAALGALAVLIGIALFIGALFEQRQAYVQCQPDYLLISTGKGRVAVAYQRINAVKTVRVGDVFSPRDYKGRDRSYIRPVASEAALEVTLSDYPVPEDVLRRRLHKFLISTRAQGFIFIVRRPTDLSLELNRFLDRAREIQRAAEKAQYQDPISRMQQR